MSAIWEAIQKHEEVISRLAAIENDPELSDQDKKDTIAGIYGELEAAFADLERSVIQWGDHREDLKVNINALKERARFYAEKARRIDDYIERVNAYAIDAMQKSGVEKIVRDGVTYALHYSEAVVVGVQPEDLPVQWQRIKTSIEADKSALKAALKAGQSVEGVEIVRNPSLRVR